jgi:tetratricopeptide (TPR) repeat protein
MIQLGEAYILAGRLEDALGLARRALAFTRERGQRPHEAWALRLLGEVTACTDLQLPAEGYLRDALARAQELEMRPLVAHCQLGLGRLCALTGKPGDARTHLSTAAAMFREMGMKLWLDKAEAAMP